MLERKPLVWFLIIAFGFSWPLFALPLAFGEMEPTTRQLLTAGSWALAMWGPGLGAIIATRVAAGEPLSALKLGRLGPKRFYVWAWLLPLALVIVAGLLTVALGLGQVDLAFSLIREAMADAPGGDAIPPEVVVAIQIATALTLAPLFNSLFALGEELGWRGFLLPRLLPLGQGRAILIGGAIWGIWHAPAIAQGQNYPGQPVLGIFMMIAFTLLMGTIFAWLYLETESPWAPTLAHASLNATAGLPILFLRDVDIVVGGTIASLVGWIGLALFVAWLVITERLPVPGKVEA
jgi:membrane protease YdiL (CAAX protease family)